MWCIDSFMAVPFMAILIKKIKAWNGSIFNSKDNKMMIFEY